MKTISCGLWVLFCLASTYRANGLTEHKVHNIVLYPDKHSWCKTTGIKQIVAYPGCSSIEIDNNVCVGACFSYSIPKTMPSAPGEVITPYCDSCQPVDFEWKEVTLTCSDESEEDEGTTEMTKKVQVITNCTCTSCDKQYEQKKSSDHQKHIGSQSRDDVPELMSLMMETHHTRTQGKELEEETTEDTNTEQDPEVFNEDRNHHHEEKNIDKENLIEDDEDEKEKEKNKTNKEAESIEILHINKHHNNQIDELAAIAKSEHKHYEIGPHHSLIIKPDLKETNVAPPHHHHHHKNEEDEETPSLLPNQFKIHDNEEFLDQIAVESTRKEVNEQKIMTIPDLIYNTTVPSSVPKANEKEGWNNGVRMLEVPHHQLKPAVEGVQLSYFGKNEPKTEKLDDD